MVVIVHEVAFLRVAGVRGRRASIGITSAARISTGKKNPPFYTTTYFVVFRNVS